MKFDCAPFVPEHDGTRVTIDAADSATYRPDKGTRFKLCPRWFSFPAVTCSRPEMYRYRAPGYVTPAKKARSVNPILYFHGNRPAELVRQPWSGSRHQSGACGVCPQSNARRGEHGSLPASTARGRRKSGKRSELGGGSTAAARGREVPCARSERAVPKPCSRRLATLSLILPNPCGPGGGAATGRPGVPREGSLGDTEAGVVGANPGAEAGRSGQQPTHVASLLSRPQALRCPALPHLRPSAPVGRRSRRRENPPALSGQGRWPNSPTQPVILIRRPFPKRVPPVALPSVTSTRHGPLRG